MKVTLALLAGASLVAAATTDPLGPLNFYNAAPGNLIGQANITLFCNITAYGLVPINNQRLTALFQIVAPGAVKLGDSFKIEQGKGRARLPPELTSFLGSLGINKLRGNITALQILAPGTTQKIVDLAKLQSLKIPDNTAVVGGQPVFFDLPATGSFSVSVKSDGKTPVITAALGAVNVSAIATSGFLGDIPTSVICPAPKNPTVIGFIRAASNYVTPTTSKTNIALVTVPEGSLVGSAGANLACSANGIGNFTLPTSLSGYVSNITAPAGSKVSIQNAHGTVTFPGTAIQAALGKYPTAKNLAVQVSSIRFRATNASPAFANALTSAVTTSRYTISSSTSSLKVVVPSPSTDLPAISFTVGNTKGALATTALADISGNLIFRSSSAQIASVPFTCPEQNPNLGLFSFNIV